MAAHKQSHGSHGSHGSSTSSVAAKYPHVAHVVPAVAAQLKLVAAQKLPARCEVEARLGRTITNEATGSSYFRSGVDEEFAAKLLCALETSDVPRTPWIQYIDRFYLLPSGLQVRTTTHVPYVEGQDVHATPPAYVIEHVIKTVVSTKTYKWARTSGVVDEEGGVASASVTTPTIPYEVRVSLKNEEPVFEEELQERVDDLDLVRVKHRKTFAYTSKGESSPTWNIDVTLVWQRDTFLEAMAAVEAGDTPVYEVEVECIRASDHIRKRGLDTAALSLLLKATDLFTAVGFGPTELGYTLQESNA